MKNAKSDARVVPKGRKRVLILGLKQCFIESGGAFKMREKMREVIEPMVQY